MPSMKKKVNNEEISYGIASFVAGTLAMVFLLALPMSFLFIMGDISSTTMLSIVLFAITILSLLSIIFASIQSSRGETPIATAGLIIGIASVGVLFAITLGFLLR